MPCLGGWAFLGFFGSSAANFSTFLTSKIFESSSTLSAAAVPSDSSAQRVFVLVRIDLGSGWFAGVPAGLGRVRIESACGRNSRPRIVRGGIRGRARKEMPLMARSRL